MEFVSFGGNQVKRFDLLPAVTVNQVDFAAGSYFYYFVALPPDGSYCEDNLKSLTILCLHSEAGITLEIGNKTYDLQQGDAAQLENASCRIKAKANGAKILIAGLLKSHICEKNVAITRFAEHKKVVKPWGHELWFNGEHPGYCLKEVMIKEGFRTSLQYHNFKEETNVLMQGSANLIYKDDTSIANDVVGDEHLKSLKLTPVSVVHVTPKVLHRIEALTDVLLYETSTPFLDDVIRVQDDKLRSHGRIVAEHAL